MEDVQEREMHRTTIEIPTKLWDKLVEEAREIGLTPVQYLRVILKDRYDTGK